MNDHEVLFPPEVLEAIAQDTKDLGFKMASDVQTGSLLRTLVASKPQGQFLELGTGTGMGTAWILSGMDQDSHLDSVESDAQVLQVAQRHLGEDSRVTFHLSDGATFLNQSRRSRYDLIYADTWPGKFTDLELALSLLSSGGFYVVDDLLPQPSWPEGHAPKVPVLVSALENSRGFWVTKLGWSTGLMLVVRASGPDLT